MKNDKQRKLKIRESTENWKAKMSDIGKGRKLTEKELQDLIKRRGY
jgi:hypothetical protein|nr:MAG TPA: hypothetical protein [Caudoviricetes sp.]DAK60885.1 MAG TPA: hypothetical protein [Caudoviricetes sp.]